MQPKCDSSAGCQSTSNGALIPAREAKSSNASAAILAAIPPILVDDAQGAAAWGVGLRTFLELQNQPWFPKPRMLGPRMKRHVLSELAAAVEHMPRQAERIEPAQLRRRRIERAKVDGCLV